MPAGPALLALRTVAPLIAASMWYEPGSCAPRRVDTRAGHPRTAGSFRERVQQLTQQIADNFAAGIAEHPADWHMMQRVWPDQQARIDESH